jgi:phage shock protein PspC (stress-responsive transcriptional regulator)
MEFQMPAVPAKTADLPAIETAQPPVAPRQPALPLRNDTILGVCQGIGEEFGFHANWLRVPIAALVIFNWMAAFGIYFALGLALLAARLIYPRRVAAVPAAAAAKENVAVSADNSEQELSAAA